MRIGRKQSSRNEDWQYTWEHIEEIVSHAEVDSLAAGTMAEIRRETAGKRAAYAYSAGKDSIVLADLCGQVGINTGFFAYCDLDYPAFVAWVEQHKPAGVEMMHTGIGLDWLREHQELIFAEGPLGQRWHQISQRKPFTKMFFNNRLDVLIMGHRTIDGNVCGPGGYIRKKSGEVRYAPLRDWSHETLLGYIHYHNLPLPPIYQWKDGWVQGTHAWPEREFCSKDKQKGYREVFDIDPSIIVKAATVLPDAASFLRG